jgi:hypothetical protein
MATLRWYFHRHLYKPMRFVAQTQALCYCVMPHATFTNQPIMSLQLEGLVKYAELRGDNEMLSALGRGHVSPSRSPISTPLRRIQSRRPLALAA